MARSAATDRAASPPHSPPAGRSDSCDALQGAQRPASSPTPISRLRPELPAMRIPRRRRRQTRMRGEGLVFGVGQASLEVTDDRPEETRCEEAWAEGAGPILTDWRKLP